MRSVSLAALVTASLVLPSVASAQQRVQRGGVTYSRAPGVHGGAMIRPPQHGVKPSPGWNGTRPGWNGSKPGWNGHGQQWGGRWNGRWRGGWNAPGGWGAYRQPVRGYVLPSYWTAPQFYVGNYASYGLSQPPYGYQWSRYYDDAVLTDGNGRVWDTARGVEWNDYDEGYEDGYEDASQQSGYDAGYASGGYYQDGGYAYDGYQNGVRYDDRGRRESGIGGALIGGAVGAVAGSAIAGRGNRLGGALIGGGVGALAGQAIDKAEDRGRRYPAPGYGAGYAPPPPAGYYGGHAGGHASGGYQQGYYGGAPQVVYAHPREQVQPLHVETSPGWSTWRNDGVTVATTNATGYAGGYYHPGATTTVVTVAGAPTTTTTVTEYVEEVEYRAPVKKWRPAAKKWRPAAKKAPVCVCR